MILDPDKFTYRVTWSEEEAGFVGLCAEFSKLSWLAVSPQAGLPAASRPHLRSTQGATAVG